MGCTTYISKSDPSVQAGFHRNFSWPIVRNGHQLEGFSLSYLKSWSNLLWMRACCFPISESMLTSSTWHYRYLCTNDAYCPAWRWTGRGEHLLSPVEKSQEWRQGNHSHHCNSQVYWVLLCVSGSLTPTQQWLLQLASPIHTTTGTKDEACGTSFGIGTHPSLLATLASCSCMLHFTVKCNCLWICMLNSTPHLTRKIQI